MVSNTKFLDKLKQFQSVNGLTDLEMAQRIGCSRQLYQKTRTEQTPLGIKILRGVINAFPEELSKDAIYFLTSGVHQLTEGADRNAHQTAQNKILGVLRAFRHKIYLWFWAAKAR
ncbi:hypothetical protein ES703_35153 [subsurface metagenome]